MTRRAATALGLALVAFALVAWLGGERAPRGPSSAGTTAETRIAPRSGAASLREVPASGEPDAPRDAAFEVVAAAIDARAVPCAGSPPEAIGAEPASLLHRWQGPTLHLAVREAQGQALLFPEGDPRLRPLGRVIWEPGPDGAPYCQFLPMDLVAFRTRLASADGSPLPPRLEGVTVESDCLETRLDLAASAVSATAERDVPCSVRVGGTLDGVRYYALIDVGADGPPERVEIWMTDDEEPVKLSGSQIQHLMAADRIAAGPDPRLLALAEDPGASGEVREAARALADLHDLQIQREGLRLAERFGFTFDDPLPPVAE